MDRYKAEYKFPSTTLKTVDGVRYIEFNDLSRLGVKNLMTTKDMDLGFTTNYGTGTVEEQYTKLIDAIPGDVENLYIMRQVHGADISDTSDFKANGDNMYLLDDYKVTKGIDGMITNKKGSAISVTVADCVPLVIYDPVNSAIANLHSGWKGTLLEIGKNGLELLNRKYGTKAEDCHVLLGPHIGSEDFEVTKELAIRFKEKFGEVYLSRKDETHWTIDLSSIIADMFKKLGVNPENIYASEESTFSNSLLYHSYRRDGDAFGIMSLTVML
ncbi:MAG: polyphenol oxidase family protein [Clostridiaceae bacterium]